MKKKIKKALPKAKKPKETVLSVLKEMRDLLKAAQGTDILQEACADFEEKKEQKQENGIFVTIGGRSHEQYEADIRNSGRKIGTHALEMLKKTSLSEKEERIDLEVISVSDLGFTGLATIKEIYARAIEKGYGICPAEVGLSLALTNQLQGEWLVIAMEPVPGSDGRSGVFGVDRDGGVSWLVSLWARPGDGWSPGDRFVFRKLAL